MYTWITYGLANGVEKYEIFTVTWKFEQNGTKKNGPFSLIYGRFQNYYKIFLGHATGLAFSTGLNQFGLDLLINYLS